MIPLSVKETRVIGFCTTWVSFHFNQDVETVCGWWLGLERSALVDGGLIKGIGLAQNAFDFENTADDLRLRVCGLSAASINCPQCLPTQFLCALFPFSDAQQRCYTTSGNFANGFDPQLLSSPSRND